MRHLTKIRHHLAFYATTYHQRVIARFKQEGHNFRIFFRMFGFALHKKKKKYIRKQKNNTFVAKTKSKNT